MISQFVIAGTNTSHPEGWARIESRYVTDLEVFEVNDWLRDLTQGRYDIAMANRPHQHMIVFFEEVRDAVWFKLSWGGI